MRSIGNLIREWRKKMGFDLDISIPAITVFLQGVLSFFSPCILPLIPLYMGYLSGGSFTTDTNGEKVYNQKKVLLHTISFIIGVSFAFFLLGLGFTALGTFFTKNQMLFSRIGGVCIVLLGCIQLGIFEKPFRGREWKLPLKLNVLQMNPITALLMGFTFSFAWTPCVGPALSTVLIMISNAKSTGQGLLLMGIYTIGFTIPFLLLGLFTTKCLAFFQKHRNVVRYTVKVGGVIMILMGVMMFTGYMNTITSYLSTYTGSSQEEQEEDSESSNQEEAADTTEEPGTDAGSEAGENEQTTDGSKEEAAEEEQVEVVPAPDFTLQDQYGNTHTLSEYKGKTVFLNVWATWCPPCREEMPDIERLYEEYGKNQEEVIILGLAFPNDENPYTQEGSRQGVVEFLEENQYTYPTVMDMTGEVLTSYPISAFPTTFMIDVEGNIFGYVPGMMTYDIMKNIIEQTIDSTQE